MTAMTSYAAIAGISAARTGHQKGASRVCTQNNHPAGKPLFSDQDTRDSLDTISRWPGYEPTPLVSLPGIAGATGVATVHYKDEGGRFGLGSFKALGGAYAVHRLAMTLPSDGPVTTVTSATDGNHGLSVAWGAAQAGFRCVIFIHADVSEGRETALKNLGAEVVRIDGNYDDSVRLCADTAVKENWFAISDTSGDPNFQEVPRTVMAGYTVMASEIVEQLKDDKPTHVFVQGGVGGLAAAMCDIFNQAWRSSMPQVIVVEPELAPCLFESARRGCRTNVRITEETMMAGLSCGEVSIVAWPVIANSVSHFLTVPDSVVAPTMQLLADAPFGDAPIVAGESAVAGIAGFIAARSQPDLADKLNLDEKSRILVFGTEGATDPLLYESITGRKAGVSA